MLKILSWARLALCLGLLAFLTSITVQIVERSVAQQVRKYDNADINHMKYGLFSVESWKRKIAQIVRQEIETFKIDDSSKEAIKKHIEGQLDILIDKVNEQITESNKESTNGWFRQRLMNMLVDVQDIKKGIPEYADSIVGKMTEDQTQAEFKKLIKKKIVSYINKTFEKQDTTYIDAIVARAGAKTQDEARDILGPMVVSENDKLHNLTWYLIAMAILLFAIAGYHRGRKMPAPYFFICLCALIVLLFAGVTCPMIDMEAKIDKFGFVLLGYNIEFLNQTVYFQSKSIIDVFWILITHAKTEMRVVGVLLILFSIIFPVLKLLFSIFYYYDIFGARKRWLMTAIVLKSGKWSMTDVQIVAIMMAYIGFNGMVTTQMEIVAGQVPEVDMISTNGTTLQIGFFIFLTYALLAIIFSWFISRRIKNENEALQKSH